MEIQVLAIVFVISGFLLLLVSCGIIVLGIGAFTLHFFPDSTFSKWINAEVFQDELEDDWFQNM